MSEFSRTILNPFDLQQQLYKLTSHAMALTGSQGAGIMLAGRSEGTLGFAAASDARWIEMGLIQVRIEAGACHDAFVDKQLIVVEDLEGSGRWPAYERRAAQAGVRAVLAVPMNAWGQTIGVLSVYREEPGPWSPDEVEAAQLISSMGSGYVLHANQIRAQHDLADQLQEAIDGHELIGQAKGILMARDGTDADTAFDKLRMMSQNQNVKLRDVAGRVVKAAASRKHRTVTNGAAPTSQPRSATLSVRPLGTDPAAMAASVGATRPADKAQARASEAMQKRDQAAVAAGGYVHLAGLFATQAELVANVVDFVTPALRDGDGVAVVVATSDHRAAVIAALTEAGLDPECDQCVFLDVDAVLASFMGDGAADRDRFRATLGSALDEHLDAGRHVRVYAELAGRLWGRDEVVAAMQVEEWADELARDRSFVLLCFYPTELFGDQDADNGALHTVVDAHTGIVHGDLLGFDEQAGDTHLGEVVQEDAAAQAIDHKAVRRERDALRQALQDAATREQVRQAFTAMVVHDIRAPTTVIAGLTEVLQQRIAELDPARVADFLATIMRNTERIERLIDDVLTVARLESEGFGYDLAPVDLAAVAVEVAAEIRQTRRRAVEVSVAPDLPPALGDVDRQVQVLENLLSNAAKFSPAGTPISVRIEDCDNRLQVHVRDQGRGIATHELDTVFEPFSRLESRAADKVNGTGLGLYITKMLVEGQGGTIDITSTPGQGTTVTYTIPVATTG